MPPSNLTNNERAYYLAPRGETFRKNPNARYRYLYFKNHGRKFENDNPNAPTVNYGPLAKKMNELQGQMGTSNNMSSSKLTPENEHELMMARSAEFLANPPAWYKNLRLRATGKAYGGSQLRKNRKTRKNRSNKRKTRHNRRS